MMRIALVAAMLLGLMSCGPVVDSRADQREDAAEAAYPPQGQIINVSGRKVHAVVRGTGPDLVLIHGASGNARDFTFSMMDRLAGRYRVIVFDRPGLGYTDRVSDRFGGATNTAAESPIEQARLLQAAAARLGADRPIVLGHSYGGAVALGWALDRPRNIAALVVVSGASNPWPGDLAPVYSVTASSLGGAALVPLITAYAGQDRVDTSLAQIFSPQRPPAGYAAYVGTGLALRRETLRANARQVNGLKPHLAAMAPRYGSITVPTEIVHGTADRVVSIELHSDKLARQIPGARLTRLPGIGHMPHHVAQPQVIAAIDRAAARAGLR